MSMRSPSQVSDGRSGRTPKRTRRSAAALRATALHEAGHAVVHLYFGLPIIRVTIDPDGDVLGSMAHHSPMMIDVPSGRGRRQIARQMILGCFAGLHAQRLVDTHAPECHGSEDVHNAWTLSRDYGVLPRWCDYIGDDAHADFMNRLQMESRRLVQRLRVPIEILAEHLLLSRTMIAEEVESVITPHLVRIG
jgi:hypothetical protein